jgi:uncharacterized protein YdeI (YjbR/CyaY-like superfamily)
MPLRATDAGEWARWLETHTEAREVWFIIRKKGSRHSGVCIEEAIEKAIAHGWIDSQMRPLDADEYLLRFTPRRDDSPWSLRNRSVAERLLNEGRMTEAGITSIEAAKRNGRWDSTYSSLTSPKIPEDLGSIEVQRAVGEVQVVVELSPASVHLPNRSGQEVGDAGETDSRSR